MAQIEPSDHSGPSKYCKQLEPTGSPSALDNSLPFERLNANKDSKVSSELGIASTLYQTCLRILTKASPQYMANPKASRQQKALLQESHARLCLFGDGLIDHGGLESCLKLDDELSGDMIALLCDTGKLLLRGLKGRALNIVDPARPHEELVSELKNLLDKASEITSQHHTEQDGDEAASTASDNDGEVTQSVVEKCSVAIEDEVLRGLDICTTTIMDIRPLLDETIHDALARPSKAATHNEVVDFKVTDAARSYVLQVHDKYPTAKTFFVERLGEANWQRYMRIKAKIATPVVYSDGQVTLQLIPDNPSLAMPIDPTLDFQCSRYVLYWTQQFLGHIVSPSFYSEDGAGQMIVRPWRRPLLTWARVIGEDQKLIRWTQAIDEDPKLIRRGQEADVGKLRKRALANIRKHIINPSPITLLRYFEIIYALCVSDPDFLDMILRHIFDEARKYLYVSHPLIALTRLFLDPRVRPFRGPLAQQGILRSLAILFKTYKPCHPNMLYILDSQTQAHLDAQEYKAAIKSAKLYLKRSELILGECSIESCQAWHMLGDAYIKQNQLQKSATAYKRAFTLQEHLTSSKYRPAPEMKKDQGIISIRTQCGLADIAKRLGQYPEARQHLEVAMHMARAAFGEDDVQIRLLQNDLDALNLYQME
ncbi:hypothetical protein GJ744_010107 [Endocarpon pusillum]|uniref:Uncharacterized protein n=1 Tax=Endocarpon pusillum TaxID=364733 RepID=A0A8H7E5R7_9EURO|nr:hypothetical protein GJ744_010107 [Endocarpon pusillum]